VPEGRQATHTFTLAAETPLDDPFAEDRDAEASLQPTPIAPDDADPRRGAEPVADTPDSWLPMAAAIVVVVATAAVLWWLQAPDWAWTLALFTCGAAVAAFVWRHRADLRTIASQRVQVRRLEGSQGQYGAAEQMASLGIWVHDLQRNRFSWSEGTFRLFGIDPSQGEPSPRGFIICIHPEDQPRWRDAHRRGIRSGREARVEYRYLREGTELIWVRSVARPERGKDGTVIRMAGIVQDITGIRAMQQQLASSENKFRELTNMSSDWVWETDAQHRVSYLSDSVDAVLGTWARTAIGQRRWEQAGDITRVDWDQHRKTVESHKPFEDFEYASLDPEGNLFHFAISGRPQFRDDGSFAGYRGIGRDITREKQQRILLQLESDVAQIMREQNEPERVVTAIIITLCGLLGWSGGAHLVRGSTGESFSVRERWGYPAFTKMVSELAGELQPLPGSAEAMAWSNGKSFWLSDVERQPDIARRYQTDKVGAKALFLSPIRDENQRVMSVLLFLSPVGYRGDEFLSQVADSLSRTLSLYLQRKAAEKRLTHASLHDALTNLPNRIYITHQLEERLKAQQPAAVLYVDLDRYKIINDTLGHSVGDQVLIEVARRFLDTLRPGDVAGRIGGDEFILLLPDITDRAEIEAIARRVLAAIEKPFILNNRAYFLSASIGVALAPSDGTDGKLLIKCADSAMYQVKSEGRNDVRFFAGGLSDERTEQLQLASELPLAIQRGEVDLYYQPIFAIGARNVVGLEALLRWRHPTRGLLRPEKFLPMAEQSNMIREIGLWAIRRALDDRVQLGLARHPDVAVSVNVSARQLAEDGFLATLNRLLEERRIPPRLLRLELTESAFIETPDRTIALIADLRRIGVRVIIDNFGTGYASLSYLKNLPVDGLKIDHAFVKNLPADRGNAAIVQAITTLAAKLGLQAMAEGVETAAEMKALRSFDCDQMQGALISEPLPFAQLQEFMESLPALRQMHLVREMTAS
jgi:diguanylate cyclase (GGDEF)-like protein/PAS domain S-box-containing protein